MGPRPGAERFTAPQEPNQRRYEALRCYFVEGLSAQAVGERFGYTRATVQTLVSDFRARRPELFASSRPGPRTQPKKDKARTLVLALRREGRSLREIERALSAEGVPLSKTAIWELSSEQGLGRLKPEQDTQAPVEPLALTAPKTKRLTDKDWASSQLISSEHAGLFLLLGELVELDISALIGAGGYPSTTQLTASNSLLALLALKLYEQRRRSHVYDIVHDRALGLFCGLNVLPKRTHLTNYSYRTPPASTTSRC
jgi:transposase